MNLDVEFRDVSRSFGQSEALKSVTFTAKTGRITGFIGRNGAGKTTALRILLGLSHSDSGSATIGGKRADQLPWGYLGYLLDPGLHPGRSGRNHLRIVGTLLGVNDDAVDESLESVGLSAVGKKLVKSYSMGMRQRLGLAAALLGAPRVLVLDEPTNGLDPDGVLWLREQLLARSAAGVTVLLSSHILSELEQVIDDVVILDQSVLWQGDRNQALAATPDGSLEGLYKSLRMPVVA